MNNVHFAIPEIYGETLSYYELLRKLVDKTNDLIENYNTVPEQIAEAVANLDASQLFSEVLNQLIHSIATDNTKSANAVKVYKKHDLLYATFNKTVNLYESLIDFSTGTATELIPGTNIREVNISELFIELRKLIENETARATAKETELKNDIDGEMTRATTKETELKNDIDSVTAVANETARATANETARATAKETELKNDIDSVTAVANENSAEITTMRNDITEIENNSVKRNEIIKKYNAEIDANNTIKTDINVNGRSGGKTLISVESCNWDDGNSTESRVSMIRCGYSNNFIKIVEIAKDNQSEQTEHLGDYSVSADGYLTYKSKYYTKLLIIEN